MLYISDTWTGKNDYSISNHPVGKVYSLCRRCWRGTTSSSCTSRSSTSAAALALTTPTKVWRPGNTYLNAFRTKNGFLRLYAPNSPADLAASLPGEPELQVGPSAQQNLTKLHTEGNCSFPTQSFTWWFLRIQLKLNTALLSTVRVFVCVSQAWHLTFLTYIKV